MTRTDEVRDVDPGSEAGRHVGAARSGRRWGAVAAALLAFVAYLPSLGGGFVFDDHFHVPTGAAPGGVLRSLGTPLFPGDLYRPLVSFSYAVTRAVTGDDPFYYHLGNVLLHAAASSAAFLLLAAAAGVPTAFVAAALFAVAPVHVEAVANVAGRSDVMAALFLLAALAVAARPAVRSPLSPPVVSLLYFAALCSKESALCFPLLLVLVVRRSPDREVREARLTPYLLGAGLATSLYALARAAVLGPAAFRPPSPEFLDNPMIGVPALLRILWAFALLGRYAVLSLLPARLSADYSFAESVPPLPDVPVDLILEGCAAALLAAAALAGLKTRSVYSSGVIWFFAAFLVTSNVVFPVGTVFAERLVYLPGLGLFLTAGALMTRTLGPAARSAVLVPLVAWSVVHSGVHSAVWLSDEELWNYQAGRSPGSAKTAHNAGVVRFRQSGGRPGPGLDEAERRFVLASALFPPYPDPVRLRGSVAAARGDDTAAESYFRTAAALGGPRADVLLDLRALYLRTGRRTEADVVTAEAYRLAPEDFRAGVAMLDVLVRGGRRKEAKSLLELLLVRNTTDPELVAAATAFYAASAAGSGAR